MTRARTAAAFAFVGLGMFPVLGSALALVLDLPRRPVQFALLGVFVLLLAGSLRVALQSMTIHDLRTRSFLWASAVAAFLVARMLTGLRPGGDRPAATAWAVGAVAFAWLVLLVYHLIVRFPRAGGTAHEPPRWFTHVLTAASVSVAAIAYLRGPEPGDAYMAFRGSTIQIGTGSAILAGVALGAVTGPWRLAALVPATYLAFVSTSRTAVLLGALLALLVIARRAARRTSMRQVARSLGGDLVCLIAAVVLVVLPNGRIDFYPYWSSRLGPEGAHVVFRNRRLTDAEALFQRYQRLRRLFLGPAVPADFTLEEVQRLEAEGLVDSRWILLTKSVRVVAAHPWGSWPEHFDRKVEIYCGCPRLCEYPHNLALEIGYHFGWPAAAAAILGLVLLGTRALLLVGHPSLLLNVASITLLGALGFTQVSGNLIDHAGALLLATAWTLVWMGTARVGEGSRA